MSYALIVDEQARRACIEATIDSATARRLPARALKNRTWSHVRSASERWEIQAAPGNPLVRCYYDNLLMDEVLDGDLAERVLAFGAGPGT